jgi:preprotein translocase subunit SecE
VKKDSSSIGRAPVSKTGGWGFDSLLSCQFGNTDRANGASKRRSACERSERKRGAGGNRGGRGPERQEMMKVAAMEHDESIGGRARESVTGWWGRSRRFLSEVRNETARVTWPSRKEVYATTLVVILTSIFFGVYLYGVDVLFSALINWIFQTFVAA